jgi:hypothetical protein
VRNVDPLDLLLEFVPDLLSYVPDPIAVPYGCSDRAMEFSVDSLMKTVKK